MKRSVKDCISLSEYRKEVLCQPQTEIARRAKCAQGWISQVERGHLPATWRRDALLKAYELESRPAEFERLVLGAAKSAELQKPIDETHPLFAAAKLTAMAETSAELKTAKVACITAMSQVVRSQVPNDFDELTDSEKDMIQRKRAKVS